MANIIIVDENNKEIGVKPRDELKKEDIYRVSSLWISNSKGEILLAKRSKTKSHDPGRWGPAAAGTIEEGETYDSNVVKEAEEELGLRNIKPRKGEIVRVDGKYNFFAQIYYLELDMGLDDFTIEEREVAEIKWFPKDEMIAQMKSKPDDYLPSTVKWVLGLSDS